MTYTLSVFNTGQITLPKKVREGRFRNAKKLIAEETEEGLLIKPLHNPKQSKIIVMPYSNKTEEGIIFPEGIDGEDLINLLKENNE